MHVARVGGSLQSNEGKAFLDFFREVASQMGKNPVISDETALEVVYDSMVEWAPALLGYEDLAVASKAEELVHELVFKAVLVDADGDEERTAKAVERGKDLGYRCLAFLRDRYITLAEPVAKRLVVVLERTARECSKLYGVDEADEEHCTTYLAVMEGKLARVIELFSS
jgi:uroporphyrinogen-III synthase